MIELTTQQIQAIEAAGQPPVLLNPKTREEFVLVRRQVFESMQRWVAPLQKGWDDPAMDIYDEEP